MSKAKWDYVAWEHDGQAVNVEDTKWLREESGEPGLPLPRPSRDAKWKALLAVCSMPKWNGAMNGVMACLIECANYYSGKCCPSETWMARKLACNSSTVKRAVAKLGKTKFLRVCHRSQASTNGEWQVNAYIIDWQLFSKRVTPRFRGLRNAVRNCSEPGAFLHSRWGQNCPLKIQKRNT